MFEWAQYLNVRRRTLLYLVDEYNRKYGDLVGRKKLNKLLFLVEFYDPVRGRIVPSTGLTGYVFIVSPTGPVPSGIVDDVEWLTRRKMLGEETVASEGEDDGITDAVRIYRVRWVYKLLRLLGKIPDPPTPAARKIREIVAMFGAETLDHLEEFTKDLLGLTKERIEKCMGMDVRFCAFI